MNTVKQILERKGQEVWTIDADATVIDAIAEMAAKGVGALVVVEGARVVGLISEREYARNVALAGRSSRDTRVRDIMLTRVPSVAPDTDITVCMALMTEHRVRHLPVMIGSELVGLVSIGDLVAAVIADQRQIIEHLEQYIASG
jgi:CBS domain-containing protein